jgi:hypothetical protein
MMAETAVDHSRRASGRRDQARLDNHEPAAENSPTSVCKAWSSGLKIYLMQSLQCPRKKVPIYSLQILPEMAARSLFSRLSLRSGAAEPGNHKSRRTPL